MSELEFFNTHPFTGWSLLTSPDAWPLYPIMPLHRDEAEFGVLIAAPGYPHASVVLLNMCDPVLRRVTAFQPVEPGTVTTIGFTTLVEVANDGWQMGANEGWGLEHLRDWDRRTEPCPSCGGRGYKGLTTFAVPCGECEATGTKVIR